MARLEALQDVEGKESLLGFALGGNVLESNNGSSNVVKNVFNLLRLDVILNSLDCVN